MFRHLKYKVCYVCIPLYVHNCTVLDAHEYGACHDAQFRFSFRLKVYFQWLVGVLLTEIPQLSALFPIILVKEDTMPSLGSLHPETDSEGQ